MWHPVVYFEEPASKVWAMQGLSLTPGSPPAPALWHILQVLWAWPFTPPPYPPVRSLAHMRHLVGTAEGQSGVVCTPLGRREQWAQEEVGPSREDLGPARLESESQTDGRSEPWTEGSVAG